MTIDCEKREKRTVGIANPTCRVTRWPAAGAAEWRAEARMRPCADVARRPASASSVVRSSAIAIGAIMRDPSAGEECASHPDPLLRQVADAPEPLWRRRGSGEHASPAWSEKESRAHSRD